jgi:hypothetical protein
MIRLISEAEAGVIIGVKVILLWAPDQRREPSGDVCELLPSKRPALPPDPLRSLDSLGRGDREGDHCQTDHFRPHRSALRGRRTISRYVNGASAAVSSSYFFCHLSKRRHGANVSFALFSRAPRKPDAGEGLPSRPWRGAGVVPDGNELAWGADICTSTPAEGDPYGRGSPGDLHAAVPSSCLLRADFPGGFAEPGFS